MLEVADDMIIPPLNWMNFDSEYFLHSAYHN